MKTAFRFLLIAALVLGAAGLTRRAVRARKPCAIRTVQIRITDRTLVGDLYLPRRNGRPVTAIVFLHGSAPLGRKLALYPALSERLAARGFLVLNLDQHGYGDSERIPEARSFADLNYVSDAREVARRISEWTDRPIRRIVMAGHSFGGGVAVAAGFTAPEIERVISISPGRRIATRFPADRPDLLAYIQQRRSKDLGLAHPIPLDLISAMLASYDIGQWRGQPAPKPLLLIEGDREPEPDLAFTRELLASMTGDIAHVVLPGADHYFGARILETRDGKAWGIADADMLALLAETIERWLNAP